MWGRGVLYTLNFIFFLFLFVPPSHSLSRQIILLLDFDNSVDEPLDSRNRAFSAVDNYSSSQNSFLFVNACQVPPTARWYSFVWQRHADKKRQNQQLSKEERFLWSPSHHTECLPWLTDWNESEALLEFPLAQCFKELCDWDRDSVLSSLQLTILHFPKVKLSLSFQVLRKSQHFKVEKGEEPSYQREAWKFFFSGVGNASQHKILKLIWVICCVQLSGGSDFL